MRYAYSPEQLAWRSDLGRIIRGYRFYPRWGSVRIPIPICPQCGEVLPFNYKSVIDVLVPKGYSVQVVDNFGSVQTKLSGVTGLQKLSFKPLATSLRIGGAADAGAVWILFLKSDGSVKGWSKLSATSGGFPGLLEAGDRFGSGVGAAGDIDGDGVPDLAVGAPFAGPGNQGAIWTVLLKRDGTVKAAHQIDIR